MDTYLLHDLDLVLSVQIGGVGLEGSALQVDCELKLGENLGFRYLESL